MIGQCIGHVAEWLADPSRLFAAFDAPTTTKGGEASKEERKGESINEVEILNWQRGSKYVSSIT